MSAHESLPADLPVPADDGLARHLVGMKIPPVALHSTDGGSLHLERLPAARTVLFVFPSIFAGEPPHRWEATPGASGCAAEACAFRDAYDDFAEIETEIYGISMQSTDDQRAAAQKLDLPFALLSDHESLLRRALRLPSFDLWGVTYLKRLTMIVEDGAIRHVFYPVFPPDRHPAQILSWVWG